MSVNTQYAPWPDELEDAVRELRYEDGWTFELRVIDRDYADAARTQPIAGGLTFIILVPCHDSYHPTRYRPVEHYHPVPAATFNRQSWERWCFDRLLDTLTHEAGEWFRFEWDDDAPGGVGHCARRPFAALHGPGDNPYVVHELATPLQRSTSYRGEVNTMTINPDNDRVEVHRGANGNWYWRRIDGANGNPVARSADGDGYEDRGYAVDAAQAYNPGLEVTVLEDADGD